VLLIGKKDDRIRGKKYNDFKKLEVGGNIHENCHY